MVEGKKTPEKGLRSMKTTSLFRIINFELFVKPNKVVMIVGSAIFLGCMGYIFYMDYKYKNLGYYHGVKMDGSEYYVKKKSNWD